MDEQEKVHLDLKETKLVYLDLNGWMYGLKVAHKRWSTLTSTVFGSSSSLSLFVGVMDWCASRLVRLICSWIILTASSPGSLFIYRSFAICLLVLPPLPSGRVKSGISY